MEGQKKRSTLKEREREAIIETLHETNWHITQASEILGLSRAGLYSKLKVHGIEVSRNRGKESADE